MSKKEKKKNKTENAELYYNEIKDDSDFSENENTDDSDIQESEKTDDSDIQESEKTDDSDLQTESLQNVEKKEDYLKKHIEREAILDQIFDDNGYKKNDVIKEGKKKIPYKTAGIITLVLSIVGIAMIGLMVYFIILNPYYIRSGEADQKLVYPELISDSTSYELSTPLEPYDATLTDAIKETDK